MRENDYIERIMKEAIKEEIENSPQPLLTKDEAWAKIAMELNREKVQPNKHWTFQKSWMFAASVLLLAASILLLSTHQSVAAGFVTGIVEKIQDVFVQFIVGGDEEELDGLNIALPDIEDFNIEKISSTAREMDLTEAQKEAPFEIVMPGYIPEGYVLEKSMVISGEETFIFELKLNYMSKDELLIVSQKLYDRKFSIGLSLEENSEDFSELTVNGRTGYFVQHSPDLKELIWTNRNGVIYTLKGNLQAEEFIRIAESM